MFTGIVQTIGTITSIIREGDWRLTIKTELNLDQTQLGASIACSGICLTVIEKTTDSFSIQASSETLSKTTMKDWVVGTRINLEPALRMGDELGGHLVTGHVDTVLKLISRRPDGDSLRLVFDMPDALSRFIAPKGSAVIDGVSLTVNHVEKKHFDVNIIPHTQNVTTLGSLEEGDLVNFEVDMIARYLDRLLPR